MSNQITDKLVKTFIFGDYFQYENTDKLISNDVFTSDEIKHFRDFCEGYAYKKQDNVYYFNLDNDQLQNIGRKTFNRPRKYKLVGEDLEYFDPDFEFIATISSCTIDLKCNKKSFEALMCFPNWIKYTKMTDDDLGIYYMSESEDGECESDYDSGYEKDIDESYCSICDQKYDSLVELGCKHKFHYNCIKTYCLEKEEKCKFKQCSARCPTPYCIKCPDCNERIDIAKFKLLIN
jgi:hypothetical protein